mmetsp:Transcript_23121/g.69263  ORF Transcript_23121/g.69263 Transcript_23121/m.69263 type:complete len:273 (+) Transcript_23121:29-847(+)
MHSTLAWRMQAHQRACTQTPRPDARTHQPHTGVPAARSGAGRPQRNWGCLAPPDRRGICTICTPGANGCCICTTCPWELYTGAAICGPAAIIAAGTAVWTGAASGAIGSATGGGASVRTSASTSAASIAAGAAADAAGSFFDFFALFFFFFSFPGAQRPYRTSARTASTSTTMRAMAHQGKPPPLPSAPLVPPGTPQVPLTQLVPLASCTGTGKEEVGAAMVLLARACDEGGDAEVVPGVVAAGHETGPEIVWSAGPSTGTRVAWSLNFMQV